MGSVFVSGGASLASPAFTGTPTAPTAAVGTDSTQIATTAFHAAAIRAEYQTLAAVGTINSWAREVVFTGTTYVATLAAIGTTTATQTPVGAQIWLRNSASGTVTVNGSGGALVVTLLTGQSAMIQAGAAAATWIVIVTPTNMALLAGTGDLADSQLSENVLVSVVDGSSRYIDLPDGGLDKSTIIQNRRIATTNAGNTILHGQEGGVVLGNGLQGGLVTIAGGRGGTSVGSDKFGGVGGNVSIYGGDSGYPSGGGTSSHGGNVNINGGYNQYGGLNGSVYLGNSHTESVWIAQGTGCKVGFFSTTPVLRQTGGAATAGNTYTATEKTMIQKAYDCLRAFGLLS